MQMVAVTLLLPQQHKYGLTNPTQATTVNTGAIIVQGGMGIKGNIYSSGNIVTTANTFGSYATYSGNFYASNLFSTYDLLVWTTRHT
jgi:hypothetical protein